MVYWYLVEENDEHIVYEYYPENRKDKKSGIITLDRSTMSIELTQPAELDSSNVVKEEDLRSLYRTISETKDVDDVEKIIAESVGTRYWFYFDHAARGIFDDYNSGEIKENGMAAWY